MSVDTATFLKLDVNDAEPCEEDGERYTQRLERLTAMAINGSGGGDDNNSNQDANDKAAVKIAIDRARGGSC